MNESRKKSKQPAICQRSRPGDSAGLAGRLLPRLRRHTYANHTRQSNRSVAATCQELRNRRPGCHSGSPDRRVLRQGKERASRANMDDQVGGLAGGGSYGPRTSGTDRGQAAWSGIPCPVCLNESGAMANPVCRPKLSRPNLLGDRWALADGSQDMENHYHEVSGLLLSKTNDSTPGPGPEGQA